MSVQLFNRNEQGEVFSELFDPKRYKNALAAGWVLSKEELEVIDVPTFEEADTNNTGKLSNKDIRAAAEKAGIEDFDKARITSLKEQLGYEG